MSLIQRRGNANTDGKYIIAHGRFNYVDCFQVSKDYGLTWLRKDATNFPKIDFTTMSLGIAMTKNGKAYIASNLKNVIYCLTNGLDNFVEISVGITDNILKINTLGCNSRGDVIIIVVSLRGYNVYRFAISRDYGKTWSVLPGFQSEAEVAKIKISSSGQYILVHTGRSAPSYVYLSSDGGNSFQKVTLENPSESIKGIAMSGNGRYMIYWQGSYSYYSADYGKTWTYIPSQLSRGNITSFDLSYDGKYMVYTGEYLSDTFVSTDYGNKWKSIAMGDIPMAAISGCGKYSVAIGAKKALQSSDFLESYLLKQNLSERGQIYSLIMSK